jgi:uncharacterized protein (DUF983 family)
MMDQCVNVVRVAPVVPLGAAIVIILTFTAAVMLIYADLKVFEKGRTWYSRIVWYMPMFSVMALIVLQFVKLSYR